MAGIRGKNTKPELLIRSGLHRRGLRFSLHRKDLPGNPDLVMPKYKAVIFVHGCFWHCHNCHLFKWPKSRPDFWRNKIEGNRANDEKAVVQLRRDGWRILVIWECALKGKEKLPLVDVLDQSLAWLQSSKIGYEIQGQIK